MVTNLAASIGTGAKSMIGKGGKATWDGLRSGQINPIAIHEGISSVRQDTSQGRSLGASLLKGGANFAAWTVAPKLMAGQQIGGMVVNGAKSAVNFRDQRGQQIALGSTSDVIGGGFNDTEQAQTMRQAAVQQIQGNKLNARSALGGEGRIFSSKKYNQHRRPYT